MIRFSSRLLIIGIAMTCGSAVMAQTILDRVEESLRRRTLPPRAAGAVVEPGYLGVIADDSPTRGQGLEIVEVVPGGPADNAGLKKHDLITGIDGRGVRRMADMAREMNGRGVGSQVEFEVVRDGLTHRIEVVLGQRTPDGERSGPFSEATRDSAPGAIPRGAAPAGPRLGIRTAPLSELDRQVLSLSDTRGAKVVAVTVGSPADRAGLVVGDVITALDGQTMDAPEDVTKAMQQTRPGAEVELTLIHEGQEVVRRVNLTLARGGPNVANAPRPADAEPLDFVPKPSSDQSDRIEVLERRIRELEARLEKLESSSGRVAR